MTMKRRLIRVASIEMPWNAPRNGEIGRSDGGPRVVVAIIAIGAVEIAIILAGIIMIEGTIDKGVEVTTMASSEAGTIIILRVRVTIDLANAVDASMMMTITITTKIMDVEGIIKRAIAILVEMMWHPRHMLLLPPPWRDLLGMMHMMIDVLLVLPVSIRAIIPMMMMADGQRTEEMMIVGEMHRWWDREIMHNDSIDDRSSSNSNSHPPTPHGK
jgi:hypothetical protein